MNSTQRNALRDAICAIPGTMRQVDDFIWRPSILNLIDALEVVDAPPAVGEVLAGLRDEVHRMRVAYAEAPQRMDFASVANQIRVELLDCVLAEIDKRIAAAASRAEAPGFKCKRPDGGCLSFSSNGAPMECPLGCYDKPAAPAEAGGGADDDQPFEPDFDRTLILEGDDMAENVKALYGAHNELNEAVRELWSRVRALAAKVTT